MVFDLSDIENMPSELRAKLRNALTPRIVEPYFAHVPHPKQHAFLTLSMREAFYGGAAGGGKSDALLMAALQYVDVPGYSALILRRTWIDLNAPGAILDRATSWLSNTPAHRHDGGRLWTFPTSVPEYPAKIQFGYVAREVDKFKFQSAEYQFIGFDELTQWDEATYTYLFSRVRKPELACRTCGVAMKKAGGRIRHASPEAAKARGCQQAYPDPMVLKQYSPARDGTSLFDVPLRVRSASNPGGFGHEWVKSRFVADDTRREGTVFISAKLKDNPSLNEQEYRESLSYLREVDREQLEQGNWDVALGGTIYSRVNFRYVNKKPSAGLFVRYWDMASTEGDGDWTVGLLLNLHNGVWTVCDIHRGQWGPSEKKRHIESIRDIDGRSTYVVMEQEGGSAGKDVVSDYKRTVFVGYKFYAEHPHAAKIVRAEPSAVAVENHVVNVYVDSWTAPFLNELEVFPHGAHDDQVDAFSGAFNFLAKKARKEGGRSIILTRDKPYEEDAA